MTDAPPSVKRDDLEYPITFAWLLIIETEQSALDVVINIFTSIVSVYSRTGPA